MKANKNTKFFPNYRILASNLLNFEQEHSIDWENFGIVNRLHLAYRRTRSFSPMPYTRQNTQKKDTQNQGGQLILKNGQNFFI